MLGLSAGALLAEGAVLVPYWRSLGDGAFLDGYRRNASRLVRFFGPLEVAAAVLVGIASLSSTLGGGAGTGPLWVSTGLATGVLVAFPLYFRQANARFAAGTIARERVAAELRRWARWHWARTALAILAFATALLALHVEGPAAGI